MEFSQTSWSFIEVLTPAIGALLAALIGLLVRWLNGKIANEQANRILTDLGNIVQDVVAETQQTLVAKLREAKKDGKFTDEEKADILKSALDTVKRNLGERGMDALTKATGLGSVPVEGFIRTKIEAAVHDMKAR